MQMLAGTIILHIQSDFLSLYPGVSGALAPIVSQSISPLHKPSLHPTCSAVKLAQSKNTISWGWRWFHLRGKSITSDVLGFTTSAE